MKQLLLILAASGLMGLTAYSAPLPAPSDTAQTTDAVDAEPTPVETGGKKDLYQGARKVGWIKFPTANTAQIYVEDRNGNGHLTSWYKPPNQGGLYVDGQGNTMSVNGNTVIISAGHSDAGSYTMQ